MIIPPHDPPRPRLMSRPAPFKVLSLIPPMTQLNTPYPSTAYLTGFLRSRGIDAVQEDLALATVLALLNRSGMSALRDAALALPVEDRSGPVNFFLDHFASYAATIEPVIAFLQGRDSTLSHRIASRGFLPEGPRFAALDAYDDEGTGDPIGWAFGALGQTDRARHLATLYLNDVADVLRDAVDEGFEFVRYAERLAASQPHFDALAEALARPPHLIDTTLEDLALQAMARHQPQLVLLSVPFPGSVYAAFRIAQCIKRAHPEVRIGLGGGFVNTELRELKDARVFDHVDFVTLDGGERPLLSLIEHLQGQRSAQRLQRTFVRNA
ncbi:MAG: hypothetical protein RLZZ95_1956, partial [Pseudomonadota bacterium]